MIIRSERALHVRPCGLCRMTVRSAPDRHQTILRIGKKKLKMIMRTLLLFWLFILAHPYNLMIYICIMYIVLYVATDGESLGWRTSSMNSISCHQQKQWEFARGYGQRQRCVWILWIIILYYYLCCYRWIAAWEPAWWRRRYVCNKRISSCNFPCKNSMDTKLLSVVHVRCRVQHCPRWIFTNGDDPLRS